MPSDSSALLASCERDNLEICWLALILSRLQHGCLISTLKLRLKPSFSFLLMREAWHECYMRYGIMQEGNGKGVKRTRYGTPHGKIMELVAFCCFF
jgi:hypothetical protein